MPRESRDVKYGAHTTLKFPVEVDEKLLDYLEGTGREESIALFKKFAIEHGFPVRAFVVVEVDGRIYEPPATIIPQEEGSDDE